MPVKSAEMWLISTSMPLACATIEIALSYLHQSNETSKGGRSMTHDGCMTTCTLPLTRNLYLQITHYGKQLARSCDALQSVQDGSAFRSLPLPPLLWPTAMLLQEISVRCGHMYGSSTNIPKLQIFCSRTVTLAMASILILSISSMAPKS